MSERMSGGCGGREEETNGQRAKEAARHVATNAV